jgi:hypothetical protein
MNLFFKEGVKEKMFRQEVQDFIGEIFLDFLVRGGNPLIDGTIYGVPMNLKSFKQYHKWVYDSMVKDLELRYQDLKIPDECSNFYNQVLDPLSSKDDYVDGIYVFLEKLIPLLGCYDQTDMVYHCTYIGFLELLHTEQRSILSELLDDAINDVIEDVVEDVVEDVDVVESKEVSERMPGESPPPVLEVLVPPILAPPEVPTPVFAPVSLEEKSEDGPEVNLKGRCLHILATTKRKGEICGSKLKPGSQTCKRHEVQQELNIENATLPQLRKFAKENGVKGFSKLNKEQLVGLLFKRDFYVMN